MKTFYVMKNVCWEDRRKGEIATRYIKAGIPSKKELVIQHLSNRLEKRKTRLYSN